jgi:ATP/maltotriose-dependent transcriptional regulator MalT
VVSLDSRRSWFRYHQMFTDFLRLGLRRTWPDEVAELHRAATADELVYGSVEAAERYLRMAERGPVPDARHGQAQLLLGIARLLLASHRGDPSVVASEATRPQAQRKPRTRCSLTWLRTCVRRR